MSRKNKTADREYYRKWRERNRAKVKAYQAQWQRDNREHVNNKIREWRAANLDKVREQHQRRRSRNPERAIWTAARDRARKDGREFTITLSDIVIPKRCPLLGIPLRMSTGRLSPNSPSLDRKNNRRGYVPGNVWVISHKANSFKKNWSADEIVAFGRALKRNGC